MALQTRQMSGQNQAKLRGSREFALLDCAERLDKNPAGHVAAHIHLSRLQKQYRRDHYMRIAANTFENLVKPMGGQIFVLSDNDIIFVTKDVQTNEMAAAVNRLRVLFQEDPLTQYTSDSDHGDFCTWYRLSIDYPSFLAQARELLENYERQLTMSDEDAAARISRIPLSPSLIAKIEESLVQADLSNIIRTQTVCTRTKNSLIPVFREVFVSIADLQNLLMPRADFLAQYHLFRHLTMALDKRVIAWACHENIGMTYPFSLNMNVATILAPEFSRLDQMISGHLRGRIVIEFQLSDIFTDMGAFIFARDWLQEHGYRICIDGITHLTFNFVDRAKLGCDLVKLYWTGGIEEMPPAQLPALKAQVTQTGQARVILCRCDSDQALAYGTDAGIVMYQGRLIERMLSAQV